MNTETMSSLDDVIDDMVIASCAMAGACDPGLNWIRETPRTYRELRERSESWYCWLAEYVAIPLVLEMLAGDANARVRRGVAKNVNTPTSVPVGAAERCEEDDDFVHESDCSCSGDLDAEGIHSEHSKDCKNCDCQPCKIPPLGWVCSRSRGHSGSCAASPTEILDTSDGFVAWMRQYKADHKLSDDEVERIFDHIDGAWRAALAHASKQTGGGK